MKRITLIRDLLLDTQNKFVKVLKIQVEIKKSVNYTLEKAIKVELQMAS